MGSNKPSVFVGVVYQTSCGACEVIRYDSAHKVTGQFEDGFVTTTNAAHVREGVVKNPYFKSVYGVGYFGEGAYNLKVGSKHKGVYKIWVSMLQRCYDVPHQSQHNPTYQGCTVSKDWHCFQNYAEDYYEILNGNVGWHIDKDILVRGNKIYSKELVCAVPPELNMLLCGSNSIRGEHPKGVSWNKRRGMFRAYYWAGSGKQEHLGYYNTPEEAFAAYKIAKEAFIKQQAEKWRDKIDPRAYEALMNYTVEITD